MSKRGRKTEKTVFNQAQKSEDVERISNILDRRTRDRKNPFLKPDGSFDLIEKFPVYKNGKKQKAKG